MSTKIPKELPESELITSLADRAENRKDTTFPFLQRLDDFRRRVSDEVQFINQLFPEYTPHDAKYHLTRLFHVADKLLTKGKLAEMNSAELFVLACGLYGHDWGMAVSESEKLFIITEHLADDAQIDKLWVLKNERERFEEFAKQHNLMRDVKNGYAGVPIEVWSSYVRSTHALRSAERARRHFEPIGEGVPEAVARVCEGHWLEFSELRDDNHFPPDFSVLGETVNLRAIAVYIRLIDLLDVADDRTPYVIWKFVAPKNPTSRMECKKHKALQPVTFPTYQQGRVIQFDGSTEDHEVFAALEDLKDYCEEQLKECKDTLALMNNPRYFLDIYHLSWRVVPRGFQTPSIRFEFDRKRMFEIFSDQIYQGNPYVFLRELLQNSIDAIRLRRNALAANHINPVDFGTIRATIEHNKNGDVTVTWTDDGAGMDEHIVKNFLAVAGKSYYSSREFEQLGLQFDPVSKFGIGILSCFLVADRIDIETRRDPYVSPSALALKISIPDAEKHFRVEHGKSTARVGTSIRVYIRGNKLSTLYKDAPTFDFQATKYLTRIAGFVEFPVVVTERDKTVVILHPEQNLPKHLEEITRTGATVHKLDLAIHIEDCTLPQDVAGAKQCLREQRFSIAKDLGLAGYEGSISFLVPNSEHLVWATDSQSFIRQGTPRLSEASVRALEAPGASEIGMPELRPGGSVFRDGILVAGDIIPIVNSRDNRFRWMESPPPILTKTLANLTSSLRPDINVSRSNLIGKSGDWSKTVRKGLIEYFRKTWIGEAMHCDPEKRLRMLARNCVDYQISLEELWLVCPQERWPIPLLGDHGQFVVKEWGEVSAQEIPLLPRVLHREAAEAMWALWFSREKYSGPLDRWHGGVSMIHEFDWFSFAVPAPAWLKLIPKFCKPAIESWGKKIRFLRGPWKHGPDILQEVLIAPSVVPAGVCSNSDGDALRRITDDSENLTADTLAAGVVQEIFGTCVTPFPPPFEKVFAYGTEWFNANHAVTKQIIRLWAIQQHANSEHRLTSAQRGALKDVGDALTGYRPGPMATANVMKEIQQRLDQTSKLLKQFGLLNKSEPPVNLPGKDELVPGTFVSYDWWGVQNPFEGRAAECTFGQLL